MIILVFVELSQSKWEIITYAKMKNNIKNKTVQNLSQKLLAFEQILQIMEDLRAQCPWDKKQTIESLRILTIEEMYELVDAITEGDMKGIEEELGDLLLHIIFYAKLGEELGAFDMTSIIERLSAKLIHRHPYR